MSLPESILKMPKEEQIEALRIITFHRVLDELCIVGLLNRTDKAGNIKPKAEIVADLVHTVESERKFINLLGRKTAAKVYGEQEGVRSAMKTVDYVLSTDFGAYYSEVLKREGLQN